MLPRILFIVVFLLASLCKADLRTEATSSAKKATQFLTDHVSTQGGYLWRYSSDLQLREGEGVVRTETVWIQPPGTPSVGEAFVRLYEATNDPQFLTAARAAGEALRRGQLRSGGWQAMIEFEPARRRKWAYRDDPPKENARDQSSLDDDKTQSAIRFAVQLDRALNFEDEVIHEMTIYALDQLTKQAQFANGGFPQIWTSRGRADRDGPGKRASYPTKWPRSYPGHQQYWYRYTLNDNLAPDVIRTLLLAEEVYGKTDYRRAALGLADFLLLAQMPEPQPAWAQQYSYDLQPIWARKFEPPAVTGGESQGVLETLMFVYRQTGDSKYLRPIPVALDYLKRSELPDGRLARFYELQTNRPLYFTKDYGLTYDDSDMPTHYSFQVGSRVDRLRAEYDRLLNTPHDELASESLASQTSNVSEQSIRELIRNLDHRGAWVSHFGLRYHKKPGPVIDMGVAVSNLNLLAKYLATQD